MVPRDRNVAMLLSDFLHEHETPFEAVLHPPAFTAQKRARFLHIPGRQVVKCVLLASAKGFYLAVLRATQHIELESLSNYLEIPVRLANENELAAQLSDCAPGAVTPFGSLYG